MEKHIYHDYLLKPRWFFYLDKYLVFAGLKICLYVVYEDWFTGFINYLFVFYTFLFSFTCFFALLFPLLSEIFQITSFCFMIFRTFIPFSTFYLLICLSTYLFIAYIYLFVHPLFFVFSLFTTFICSLTMICCHIYLTISQLISSFT